MDLKKNSSIIHCSPYSFLFVFGFVPIPFGTQIVPVWPTGAPSRWLLHPFAESPVVFEHLAFQPSKTLEDYLAFPDQTWMGSAILK